MTDEKLIKLLFSNQDLKYKDFSTKINNTNKRIIGVRSPILKKIAKDILKSDYNLFLNDVKDEYYEEILIEGLVISGIKDFDLMLKKLDKFIKKIDNWAICDMVIANCKSINKNKEKTFNYVKKALTSTNPWKVRCAFDILLSYFIEEKYLNEIFKLIDNDKNDFYYVMMVKAWLISICYVKYPKETLNYLKHTKIDDVTFNKAISKICDSFRVTKEDKIILKKMKKKSKCA